MNCELVTKLAWLLARLTVYLMQFKKPIILNFNWSFERFQFGPVSLQARKFFNLGPAARKKHYIFCFLYENLLGLFRWKKRKALKVELEAPMKGLGKRGLGAVWAFPGKLYGCCGDRNLVAGNRIWMGCFCCGKYNPPTELLARIGKSRISGLLGQLFGGG